ncbi:hypothetical protein [Conexibacter woesei]|uniref:hypothetical protein n=1 Tax=Conexibacter woesei TaxID=191495 RepID=UPI0004011F1A|nr:hypothetical protein [Conexibacter woesei]
MSPLRILLLTIVLAGVFAAGLSGRTPTLAHAAACSDYPNQAAAQAAGDTRDPDGDGIYCESLPCACSTVAPDTTSSSTAPAESAADPARCRTPPGVQDVTFSKTKYPNIRRHFLRALRRGWPRTLVLNRPGAARRRARLLEGVATKPGYDRDEYPPAVARGRGPGLTRGSNPMGWRADVALVPSAENRSHGSTMGLKLRRFCSGTKFRYVFY